MKKDKIFLIFLVIIFVSINYNFLDSILEENFGEQREFGIVERVVDGDTIHALVNGEDWTIRLLGINTPEKGEKYSELAKEFLEKAILNKTVELRFGKEKYDRYNRVLAYIFYKGANINLNVVEEGYANFYFPSGKDIYYKEFFGAWEHCLEVGNYLCEKSRESCVELKDFNSKKEIIVLKNKCSSGVNLENWEIKDEGRKKFIFTKLVLGAGKEISIITGEGVDTQEKLYWSGQDYVWTDTGDTFFLRDSEGKLVLWKSY